jgi:hypothetical protein
MFPARAKRVIFLFMHGGPSSIDTFDPKPYLDANDGKPLPIKQPLTFAAKTGGLMKSPWKFKNCGQSGLPISDLFPEDPRVRRRPLRGALHGRRRRGPRRRAAADFHRHVHLHPAQRGFLGALRPRLPESQSARLHHHQAGALARRREELGSGFLPGSVQGTAIGNAGMQVSEIQKEPIEYLVNQGLNREQQRYELDMIQAINRKHQELWKLDDELETRIQSFEMGFRMQAEALEGVRCFGRIGSHQEALRPGRSEDRRFRLAVPARAPSGRS